MKGIILAAGYGTRLYPLTLDRPKPLIKVGGKTILERLLRKLEQIDTCDGVYIVTNNKFAGMVSNWVAARSFSMKIEIINDLTNSNEDRLGAIGDIDLVLKDKDPKDELLIIAGDNLFEFDIKNFIFFSRDKKTLSIALFDVKDKELAKRYGIVSIEEGGKIKGFQEKPEEPQSTLASTGIYYLTKEGRGLLDDYMKTDLVKDAPGNFVKWVSETSVAFGYVFTEGWYDIGDKKSLEKADIEYREREL
ncbi:MAG: nucleotidyltransferase family protein [Candidatus Omnitrophota bacterium]